jgi:hypothetical protein
MVLEWLLVCGPRMLGGEAGIRPLRTQFLKLMMAKDFWQQVFANNHVPAESLSTNVSASVPESTPVLATLWQRSSLAASALEWSPFQPAAARDA